MTILEKIEKIKESVNARWVQRSDLIDATMLSIFSGADLLAIGKPGVAKSAVIKDVLGHFNVDKFSRQLNQYSTDKDLLGDINPKEYMENGVRVHNAPNTLLDCDLAFVDEVFKGTKGARAALLEPLADRQFSENGEVREIPLLAMLTASNELPSDKADAAFYSRLQLRVLVKDIETKAARMKALWTEQPEPLDVQISRQEILEARKEIQAIRFSTEAMRIAIKVFDELTEISVSHDQRKRMRAYGNRLSLAQAEAWLNGHDRVQPEDLRVGRFVFWSVPDQINPVTTMLDKVCSERISEAVGLFNEAVEMYGMKTLDQFDSDQLKILLNLCRKVRRPQFHCRLTRDQRDQIGEITEEAAKQYMIAEGGA